VVHRQHQQVLVLLQPQERGAKERIAPEVEGARPELARGSERFRLARGGGGRGKVDRDEREVALRRHHLDGRALHLEEVGAERLVAPNDLRQAVRKRGHVQGPPQPQRRGDVVDGKFRFQLVQEPEPLLSRGEGKPVHRLRRAAELVHLLSNLNTRD
jgi:hypothetical protein